MIQVSLKNIVFDDNSGKVAFSGSSMGIKITGHAGADSRGKDIICSAVSALSQTIVLSISRTAGIEQTVKQHDGYLETEIIHAALGHVEKNALSILVTTLLIGIIEIKMKYPEYVHIENITG